MLWIVMAVLSAFFAGLTSILGQCGIQEKLSRKVLAGLLLMIGGNTGNDPMGLI